MAADGSDQSDPFEFVRGQDRLEVRVTQVGADEFAEHVAEIRGVQQVALFV